MNDYDFTNYGYQDNAGFYGIPQQITDEIYAHNVAVTTSIDAQTIQQHEDSESAITVRHEDAVETRNTINTVFGNLIKTFRKLFGKDDGEGNEGEYYSMMKSESDQTQQLLCAQTATMKSESDETQGLMTAHTAMEKSESDETQNIMTAHTRTIGGKMDTMNTNLDNINKSVTSHTRDSVSKLEEIKKALTAHTDTEGQKLDNIKTAITQNTSNIVGAVNSNTNATTATTAAVNANTTAVNNVKSAVDNVDTAVDELKSSNESWFNKIWNRQPH